MCARVQVLSFVCVCVCVCVCMCVVTHFHVAVRFSVSQTPLHFLSSHPPSLSPPFHLSCFYSRRVFLHSQLLTSLHQSTQCKAKTPPFPSSLLHPPAPSVSQRWITSLNGTRMGGSWALKGPGCSRGLHWGSSPCLRGRTWGQRGLCVDCHQANGAALYCRRSGATATFIYLL